MTTPLTSEQAIERLRQNPKDYATPETLRSLAAQVDADAPGRLTVLYSGPTANGVWSADVIKSMLDADEDVRVINKSQAASFLESRDFKSALAQAYEIRPKPLIDGIYRGPATEWLYHATEGPWADASARFVDATKGEVRAIVSGADPVRTFGAVELPHALNNTNIPSIEGIPRETLVARQASHGTQAAFEMVVAQSHENVGQSRVAVNYAGTPLRGDNGQIQLDSRSYFRDTAIEGKAPAFAEVTRPLADSMKTPSQYVQAGQVQLQSARLSLTDIDNALPDGRAHVRTLAGASSALVLGAAVETYQWKQTLDDANTFSSTLGNETAAKEVLLRQSASSSGGAVGGVMGTGLAAGLGVGSGGTFALVAAEAYFFSAVADKAVTLWQHDKIYTQKEEGVEWKYNGKNWLREDLRGDLVRDGDGIFQCTARQCRLLITNQF